MFVVSITYICNMSEVDKHLSRHIEYLEKHYASGAFLASGRKVPRIGGVILAQAETKEALDQILSEDPFQILGLARYDIIEFIVSKTSPELEFLMTKNIS